ncbi:MAG TPA: hypothetical protein VGR62_06245 [Candidatus Binatia bacterium]|nr:hypothetical protein [Candidatus Binatia bacterium]
MSSEPTPVPGLSLLEDDPSLRFQRVLHLLPRTGLGVGRRALILAAVAWVPIAIWAAVYGRVLGAVTGEPLLQHFGVQVRALLAIPLLVIAEGVGHGLMLTLIPYFLTSGMVPAEEHGRFVDVLERMRRLRDASLPWVSILALVIAVTVAPAPEAQVHEVAWAAETVDGHLGYGFGGWWFMWVTRPLYLMLLLGWLWRLVLTNRLLAGIAKLPLAIVPTHADGLGGLGFLQRLPVAFAPVVLAISSVLASRWGHDVMYHGVHIDSLKLPAATFLVVVLIVFHLPLLAFTKPLAAAKRQALLDYGALVGRHGRLVRRRWILNEATDSDLLSAPEIGPVADTIALYDAVKKMGVMLIGKQTVAMVLLPAAIPLVFVAAVEVPVKDMLLTVLKAVA